MDHTSFPFVYLDATYLHVREDHHVVSKAVVIATGVSQEGVREVLGFGVGGSADEVFWRGFLTGLRKRGLQGVRLVISDQHAGSWRHCGAACRGPPTSAAGCTSLGTCWPQFPRATRRWSPGSSLTSSMWSSGRRRSR